MKKVLSTLLLLYAFSTIKAQITYSITLPDSIPNYDGTYDDFGQSQLYYPNDGEVRLINDDETSAIDYVKYYTMNTYPKRYLLNDNSVSLCFAKSDTAGVVDSLQRIDLQWIRTNGGAALARIDTQQNARLNYFTQWFSSSGRTNVMGGAAIACQSIYNNIDLVYTSNNAGLVLYFIVYPGGNYNDIYMQVNGSTSNSISGNKLKLNANWEYMTLEKPEMYQYTISGSVVSPVTVCNANWQSAGSDVYQISTSSSYNPSLPLIIQIKQASAVHVTTTGLDWSTYFGGYGFEFLTKTHCDASDNLYIAGNSTSLSHFPTNHGVASNPNNGNDGVIAEFDNAGVLLWSTFVGGSSQDEIHDFDFDSGNIYCVGKTASSDLVTQTKSGASPNNSSFGGPSWDGFIFEFNFNPASSNFTNSWLTYFGGNGDEELNACKFDGSGNMFIAGESASDNMSIMAPSGGYLHNFNNAQLLSPGNPLSTDGIIGKFNTSSNLQWYTFFGTDTLGTNAHNNAGDYFYGLTISGTDVYTCGKSGGTNLPGRVNNKMVSGNFDGILVHFTTSGALGESKYTDGNISNYAVKTLGGEVYTVGQANSSMSPVNSSSYYYNGTASGSTDACFSVNSQNLSATATHNTFLGGNSDDAAYDIQFNSNNLFFISGGTNSSNFPTNTLGSMYVVPAQALNDNFLSCFQKTNTNILWSSYLGSPTFNESLQYPTYFNSTYNIANTSIALNSQNVLYTLGTTNSFNDFPLDPWTGPPTYYQSNKSGAVSPLNTTNDGSITRFTSTSIGATVGLKDFENTQFVFGLYPNPTSKNISITNPAIANDDLRFAIYDMSGKKLKDGSLKSGEVKNIDVSLLSQGIYIINVSNGTKTYCNKFVKVEN